MWPWPQCHSRGLKFLSIISWTIFWQDLTRNLMGQFKICQLVLNVLFLLQIYVCVVIREPLFCLFLTINKLMLLQHWTLSQDKSYFKQMVSQIYPIELQLNMANTSDTEVSNGAKIRNRYNQVPHLTQDTNGKVTNSQKTPQTRAKRSALSQQVTKKHI